VARWAGTKRIVEREQTRLRHFVGDAAPPALEALTEPVRRLKRAGLVHFDREGRAVTLMKRRFDGVGEPRTHVRTDPQSIDDDGE
jgi:hypothetical protein